MLSGLQKYWDNTDKVWGSATETALAGFPHHSINTYLPKLVKAGLRATVTNSKILK
jgi:DNA mismatch repair ATPase MutS